MEVRPAVSSRKYTRTNGCSRPPSKLQILGLVLVGIVIVLHANIISLIIDINHSVLTFFLAFYFTLLLLIIYDYLQLLLSDPVDPRLRGPSLDEDQNSLKWCKRCNSMVHTYSYHCKRCDRCVEEFDHHCKFVNNCVGKQNYSVFYRFILALIMFLMLALGQGLWVVLASPAAQRWVGLALAVLSGLFMLPLLYLALFHCYISFWGWGTTLRWIM